jgi:hypothetical protein
VVYHDRPPAASRCWWNCCSDKGVPPCDDDGGWSVDDADDARTAVKAVSLSLLAPAGSPSPAYSNEKLVRADPVAVVFAWVDGTSVDGSSIITH